MSEQPKEIRIDGLTNEQCDLLDLMYACDNTTELRELISIMDTPQRQTCYALMQLVMYEHIEEDMMRPMIDRDFYPDAVRIINKIRKNLD